MCKQTDNNLVVDGTEDAKIEKQFPNLEDVTLDMLDPDSIRAKVRPELEICIEQNATLTNQLLQTFIVRSLLCILFEENEKIETICQDTKRTLLDSVQTDDREGLVEAIQAIEDHFLLSLDEQLDRSKPNPLFTATKILGKEYAFFFKEGFITDNVAIDLGLRATLTFFHDHSDEVTDFSVLTGNTITSDVITN